MPLSDPIPEFHDLPQLYELVRKRDQLLRDEPHKLNIYRLRPCRVRVLLVADGGLDFSLDNFGLRTFVETLLTMPGGYAKFEVTLAHIDAESGEAMMDPDPRISRRIASFKFDDPAHFAPEMYDQVWLFGIATFYARAVPPNPNYPPNRLGDLELAALTRFMNGGGGVFATGDHGSLGACLCSAVPRVRSMRKWGPAGNDDASEVSMTHSRRNDTNQTGSSAGSQFDDQSDDTPQRIAPKMYGRRVGPVRFSYPHPLLCSPKGVIRVMPDHPHEGECTAPTNPDLLIDYVAPPAPEYPPASDGGLRPLPEVISTNSVPAGNTSSGKDPTDAQSFGGICAYDGHQASVGRVVTDSTWHHFVNINLVGDAGAPPGNPKRLGFLALGGDGPEHLHQIQTYYRNIAVWLARPSQHACMQRRLKWGLLWTDRVIEAVATRADLPLEKMNARLLLDIGRHARDVLGRSAGQCQALRLVLYEVERVFPKPWPELLDPWRPRPPRGPLPDPVPWLDPELLVDIALGGTLAALRERFPRPDPQRLDEIEPLLDETAAHGVRVALGLALNSYDKTLSRYAELFDALKRVVREPRTER